MKYQTLETINQNPRADSWGDSYRLHSLLKVGRIGWGAAVHLLSARLIVGYVGDYQPKPGQYREGQYFQVGAACNANGQQKGRVVERLELADITCRHCRKAIEQYEVPE